ncbi:MAG TPA: DUF4149 domain-containing protein [Pyrinomonadaceae bacterium]|nr:DUF4149 domain-containing protein [Pyrinomonadaceae bacterium]
MSLITGLRTFLIALWLGAAVFFVAAVAQSAFAVLPSRELAGAIVNRTLAILNYSGIVVGLILLAGSVFDREKASRVRLWVEQGLLLFLTAACAFAQFVIGARLHAVRQQIGRPIDELAADDPLRVAFGALHGYSVAVLAFAMLAALVVYFLIARKRSRDNFIR